MYIHAYFNFSEDSGKPDGDLDDSWIMTVRGPNSIKSPSESNASFPSEWLSKKTHQNGSLQSSKKSSHQKSNVESSVSNCCPMFLIKLLLQKEN